MRKNIKLNKITYNNNLQDVLTWIKSYGKEMLYIPGFKKFKIYFSQNNKHNIIIPYYIKSPQEMDIYIEKYSKQMRNSNNYPKFIKSF
tara:strand:+ start:297 stop:560 length:264 start_codon:yes stop_codon:yes gene_type:complete